MKDLNALREEILNPVQEDLNIADLNIAPPKAHESMLYGLAGEIGRTAALTTEANPYAVCMDALILLSAEFGRDIFLPIGNTWHHPRLFGLHVGRTGRGRKGDAASLPLRIRAKTSELYLNLLGQLHTGGLSSREGLVCFIHDGFTQGKEITPPIDDKRLFVIESEFSNILHQAKRDGNTLSSALRDCWDGQSLKPATKTNRLFASDPHIALLGHITPSELIELMKTRELSNGFANRFLIFFAERNKLVPHPKPTPKEIVEGFADSFKDVISFARGQYPYSQNTRRASLSATASKRYEQIYYELAKPLDGGIIDAILERRPAHLLRLALIFALIDQTLIIDLPHLEAAYAWIGYCTESVRFIFQSGEQEGKAKDSEETAHKIYRFLEANGKASKTQISNELFNRNKSSIEIDEALKFLLAESPPKIGMYEPPKTGNGRTPKIYFIATNLTKETNYQQPHGFKAVKSKCELSEFCELSPPEKKVNSHYSQTSQTDKNPVSIATPDTSHYSHDYLENNDVGYL